MNLQVSGRVGERVVLHVNKKSKVGQEISTKYGLFDIGNDEHPPEGAAQAKVEVRERTPKVVIAEPLTARRQKFPCSLR